MFGNNKFDEKRICNVINLANQNYKKEKRYRARSRSRTTSERSYKNRGNNLFI